MGKHRAGPARPRYGRISVLATSLVVTLVAVLGASGVLPATLSEGTGQAAATTRAPQATPEAAVERAAATRPDAVAAPVPAPVEAQVAEPARAEPVQTRRRADTALPADSGTGRRVVFSQSRQRVWLVEADGRVARTYQVSGSLEDNLDPGTYTVYSRSEDAVGIDDSGTMKHFVRFTRGPSGAAIGFHDIPVDDGRRVQTLAQLGTPQSHGCIRQRTRDAIVLWEFAPLGTTVVVSA